MKVLVGKADSNGDGRVSMDEMKSFSRATTKEMDVPIVAEQMKASDKDGDGKTSLEEHLLELFGESRGGEEPWRDLEVAKFQLADEDHDGMLNVEELAHIMYPQHHDGILGLITAHKMTDLDQNEDGKINLWEFDGGDANATYKVPESQTKQFNGLDRNGDGELDLEEMKFWEASVIHVEEEFPELFKLADRNGDGHVTYAELEQVRKQMHIDASTSHGVLLGWAGHHEL